MARSVDRFVFVAYFQLVAAIGIALRHYSFFLTDSSTKEYLSKINFVEFFFCCSGFFLCRSYFFERIEFFSFTWRRLKRIYPAHFVATLFFVFVLLARELGFYKGQGGNVYDFSDLPAVIFLAHSLGVTNGNSFNYPSWYLSAQFFMYLLFIPVLYFLRKNERWAMGTIVMTIICSIFFMESFSFDNDKHWTDWTYDYGVLRAVPSFLTGMVFAYCSLVSVSRVVSVSVPFVFLLICFYAFLLDGLDLFVYFVLQAALLGILAFTKKHRYENRLPAYWLGVNVSDMSFGIYIFHVPVAAVLLSGFYRKFFGGVDDDFFVWVSVALSLFASCCFSYFWFRFIFPALSRRLSRCFLVSAGK